MDIYVVDSKKLWSFVFVGRMCVTGIKTKFRHYKAYTPTVKIQSRLDRFEVQREIK